MPQQISSNVRGLWSAESAGLTRPEPGSRWQAARERFLAAIDPELRPTVAALLARPHYGGLGLRLWLRALAGEGTRLPDRVPSELIRVYLDDPEAVPLYDCAECGLAVPARPRWDHAEDGDPERVYFPICPHCGGRTGLYAYFANTNRRVESV